MLKLTRNQKPNDKFKSMFMQGRKKEQPKVRACEEPCRRRINKSDNLALLVTHRRWKSEREVWLW